MPDAEQDSHFDEAAVYALVAQMLRRNDWQLLEATELTRQVIALLRDQQRREQPEPDHRPPPARTRTSDPLEAAALRIYAEVLYAAFAGHTGEERQHRAYAELFRYIGRVLFQKAPALSRDEREELAYDTIAELYYRLPPGQYVTPQRMIRFPGAFIAIALQESWNTLHRWQNAARHLQHYEQTAVNGDLTIAAANSDPPTHLISEDDLSADVERSEYRAQVRACFVRTWKRYPRSRLQLYVLWLHIVEEQDYPTIANTLGMSIENVRVLCCRGRKRLRRDPEWLSLAVEESLSDALQLAQFSTRSAEFQRGQDHE